MDPNEALIAIRKLAVEHEQAVEKAERAAEGDSNDAEIEALYLVQAVGERLVETFRGLDTWLCASGFLPTPWERKS
jgi:hypothetical protein